MFVLVKWNPGKRPWVPFEQKKMAILILPTSQTVLWYLFIGLGVTFVIEWRMYYQIGELTTWRSRIGCILMWPYAVYLWIKMRYFE